MMSGLQLLVPVPEDDANSNPDESTVFRPVFILNMAHVSLIASSPIILILQLFFSAWCTKSVLVIAIPSTLKAVSNVLSSPPQAQNMLAMEFAYIPCQRIKAGLVQEQTTLYKSLGGEGQPSSLEKPVEAFEDVPDCVRMWTS